MGGLGSGRRSHWHAKGIVENHFSIDVRRWRKLGLLRSDHSFAWHWFDSDAVIASINVRKELDRLVLNYRYTAAAETCGDVSLPTDLYWTDCNLGGQRPWFLCPAENCGQRVALLYFDAGFFACRHCLKLVYRSQREAPHQRAMRMANRIRAHLQWPTDIHYRPGGKPRGMHWSTFARLKKRHDSLVLISEQGFASDLTQLTQLTQARLS
ncbi:hypothetical protein KT71_002891 [Congregibacter litoralis KT71]|uniref:Uncharacterized protein n=1 Tax=Congregibacter litoralis KT71 TaxID=314285 RepID=V7HUU8_9GAMM|nr:hypothetical protein KT71_002891 [Congregibacter litoralis KT71]